MNSRFFHECEVKYQIPTAEKRQLWEQLITTHGFILQDRQLQTDFLPDTTDSLLRQHGILLRFRRVIAPLTNDIILTLKIKGDATTFQENFELEYRFSNVKQDVLGQINEILQQATGKTLPSSIHAHDPEHFADLIAQVKTLFPAHRILLEKKRTTFTKGDCHALFDTLPEGIGDYLELEAPSPEKLRLLVNELGLQAEPTEPLDYGDILKRHKKGRPDQEARTGLFGAQEKEP